MLKQDRDGQRNSGRAMADDASFLAGLSPAAGRPVQVTFTGGQLTSDGGVLVLAESERRPRKTKHQLRGCRTARSLRGLGENEELRGFAEDDKLRGLAEAPHAGSQIALALRGRIRSLQNWTAHIVTMLIANQVSSSAETAGVTWSAAPPMLYMPSSLSYHLRLCVSCLAPALNCRVWRR